MTTTRRDLLAGALTAAGAAVTPDLVRAQEGDHDHGHQAVPSDPALRVKALESLLVAKGIVDPAALDALVDAYERQIGPRNGARVVARAWVDPAYKQRLMSNATAAIAELGSGKHPQGAQPRGLHPVLVLPVSGARLAAGLVQVGRLPLAGRDRSTRPLARVRTRTREGRGSARLGQYR